MSAPEGKHASDFNPTTRVLGEVLAERAEQDARWGEQNHSDVGPPLTRTRHREYKHVADNWKATNGLRVERDKVAWDGILLEEVYEALAESDPSRLREELVQVAAVATCWIECIDRRGES